MGLGAMWLDKHHQGSPLMDEEAAERAAETGAKMQSKHGGQAVTSGHHMQSRL